MLFEVKLLVFVSRMSRATPQVLQRSLKLPFVPVPGVVIELTENVSVPVTQSIYRLETDAFEVTIESKSDDLEDWLAAGFSVAPST